MIDRSSRLLLLMVLASILLFVSCLSTDSPPKGVERIWYEIEIDGNTALLTSSMIDHTKIVPLTPDVVLRNSLQQAFLIWDFTAGDLDENTRPAFIFMNRNWQADSSRITTLIIDAISRLPRK